MKNCIEENYKKKVFNFSKKIESFYKNKNYYGIDLIYLSTLSNSMGYPPSVFANKKKFFSLTNIIKGFYLFSRSFSRFILIFLSLKFFSKINQKKIKKNKYDAIESQIHVRKNLRKSIACIKTIKVLHDINVSFLTFKILIKINTSKNFTSSIFLLNFYDLLKALIITAMVMFYDYRFHTSLFFLENNKLSRIFFDIIKILSIQKLLKIIDKKYILFWENRGWQNFLAKKDPEKIILICSGFEGFAGPIYSNNKFMEFQNTIYFESKFHYNHCLAKKKILKKLPTSIFNSTRLVNKLRKNKILLYTNLNIENTDLAIKLVKNSNFLTLRPHPELINYTSKFLPPNKIDKSQTFLLFSKYICFLSIGTSSLTQFLITNGAPVAFLSLSNYDNFFVNSNKIINIKDITSKKKIILKANNREIAPKFFTSAKRILMKNDFI